MPAHDLLKVFKNSSDKFVFEYPLKHLIEEGISDEFVTRVALPEGAKVLKVETLGVNTEISYDKTFSHLDFLGRPTVVIKIKNHLPQATKGNLKITY